MLIFDVVKCKITKILNSEENSKWKVHNQMAKSKAQKMYFVQRNNRIDAVGIIFDVQL